MNREETLMATKPDPRLTDALRPAWSSLAAAIKDFLMCSGGDGPTIDAWLSNCPLPNVAAFADAADHSPDDAQWWAGVCAKARAMARRTGQQPQFVERQLAAMAREIGVRHDHGTAAFAD